MARRAQRPNRTSKAKAKAIHIVVENGKEQTLSPEQHAEIVGSLKTAFRGAAPIETSASLSISRIIFGESTAVPTSAAQVFTLLDEITTTADDLKAMREEGSTAEPEEARELLAKLIKDACALVRFFDAMKADAEQKAFSQVPA